MLGTEQVTPVIVEEQLNEMAPLNPLRACSVKGIVVELEVLIVIGELKKVTEKSGVPAPGLLQFVIRL